MNKEKCIMKKIRRITAFLLVSAICATSLGAFSGCSSGKKEITIYSSAEDYRNQHAREMLTEKFPEYEIKLVDTDTGSLAARVAAEGKDSEIDIVLELETTYLEKASDNLAELKDVDFSVFEDAYVPASHKYTPWLLMSGAIIVDTKALADKGLEKPASYDDLLKPEYKGLISMPNPKSSGTGYIFLLNMVNERGEDAAFEYFDKLAENMSGQGFTTSGSGPVKALLQGEAAIGLGMTFQAATEITNGADFEILFFDEGAPYTTYSSAVMIGKETDEDVMKVFNYIISDVSPEDKRLYNPEKIFKNQQGSLENFPETVPYGNMEGIRDIDLKESLLEKWNH